jgi:ATP synthase protein I
MQSNDARMLLHTAVPTAAVGVIAVAVSAVLAGGKGAVGAVFGTLVVILFMGVGLFVLQGTARKYPDLFQAMGLMLYTTQLLALFIFVAIFKDTTLFSAKAFAASLVVATLVWIAGQARAHMKAKILYVEPEGGEQRKADSRGASA